MSKKKADQVYVAKESGHVDIDGKEYSFHQGRTRVAGDSVLAGWSGFDGAFEAAEDHLSYRTEEATAAPGERRDVYVPHETGADEAATVAAEEITVVELRQQLREAGGTPGTKNKAELLEALAEAEGDE